MMHGHKGIKASELIAKLKELVEKHGDQRVVCYCDHDPVGDVCYEAESWIGEVIDEYSPAFEINRLF